MENRHGVSDAGALEWRRDYDQLVYAVSHDMGAPLRAICVFAELLEEEVGPAHEKSAHYTQRIIRASLQLRSMVDGLLTHSRVGRRKSEASVASVDEAWQAALRSVQDDLQGARIEVLSPLPRVRCDLDELTLMFTEALKNASTFRSEIRELVIHLSVQAQGDAWLISLSDNGLGLPPATGNRAFEIFSRLHGEEYPGAGMGLPIIRRIANHWGGTARLDSSAEVGVTLHLSLPIEPEQIGDR